MFHVCSRYPVLPIKSSIIFFANIPRKRFLAMRAPNSCCMTYALNYNGRAKIKDLTLARDCHVKICLIYKNWPVIQTFRQTPIKILTYARRIKFIVMVHCKSCTQTEVYLHKFSFIQHSDYCSDLIYRAYSRAPLEYFTNCICCFIRNFPL